MENSEAEKSSSSEESIQLARNRSFKSKQLVRSQAIRESTSPPRIASPATPDVVQPSLVEDRPEDQPSNDEEVLSQECGEECRKTLPVEIQITSGTWDEQGTDQRLRTKRWLGQRQQSRDLLSYNPRVACVCGACHACPHCRGRRRKPAPSKQDSGIVCSEDCPDCSDCDGKTSADGDLAGYCRCPERKEKPKSISLSRTDSDEKTEPTGADLVNFLKETLNKNARDRMTLLRIEKELHALVNDTGRCIVKFPVMTSYGRLLVHRVASLFQLSHRLDQSNKNAVLVSKSGTSGGRIPCTSFKQWCTVTFPPSPSRHQPDVTHAKSILKRDAHSLDEPGAGALCTARSKSLEQREKEYERVRRRIFSSDNCTQDESQWQWLNSGPVKLLTADSGRNKLLKVQSLEGNVGANTSCTTRGAVSKSHSFGGYGRQQPDTPRLLSRQGDLASSSWRLSPSSSGYRTLSLHSTDSVTPSPTGGASPEPTSGQGLAVVWAVTDMSSVPPGALVIHPQTGRPLTNPDGSVYHFDPTNPPTLSALDANLYQHTEQKTDNCEKKRGRLEKQHSFIDNECDCTAEECRSKCCQCRRRDACHCITVRGDKTPTKIETKPTSPCKNQYEQPVETTNHNTAPEATANHRPAYDPPTNQKPPEIPTNQRPAFEIPAKTYESPTQIQRPPSYDANQKYELANQRSVSEAANQRPLKLANRTPDIQYIGQQYQQVYSHEEVTPPPQAVQYMQTDLGAQAIAQVKPVQVADPNIRPMSLGMMYPSVPQYQYPVPLYRPVPPEEQKTLHPSHPDNTFRIDPSYPYQPMALTSVDYTSQAPNCSGCDTTRPPYALYTPITPIESVPAVYPVHQSYPYQEQLQWQNIQPLMPVQTAQQPKLYVPDMYPIMQYPAVYPQYNVMYPQQQVIQPTYNVVQPSLYTTDRRPTTAPTQRHSKRNSISGSSRTTPLQTPPDDKKVPYNDTRNIQTNVNQQPRTNQDRVNQERVNQDRVNQERVNQERAVVTVNQAQKHDSNEIAATIQQIKEQMAQMNTRERDDRMAQNNAKERDERRDKREWKRRNSGNGILGSYPVNQFNGRFMGRPQNDETQLSSAARAIVNSIRNMQAKNNYPDRRPDHYRDREFRQRRPDDKDRTERTPVPYRPDYLLRQMSPGTWCRRSPGPIHPVLNPPRRPHPDNRNNRR